MSPRTLLIVASAALAVTLLLLFLDIPGWLPPRVEPLPLPPDEPAPSVAPHAPLPGEICARHALRVCEGGDVWWHDGCGRPEERAESCDDTLCEKGRCVPPETGPPCEKLSEGGRCDGEILRYCDHGRARAVDCAASGRRCGRDLQQELHCLAARCLPGEPCFEQRLAATCADEDDELQSLLCGPQARCELDAHHHPRCLRRPGRPLPCQGCACPSPSPMEALAPIDVVAFIVADEHGHAVESEERARAALVNAAELFAQPGHGTGLWLTPREVRTIVRPGWLSATRATLHEAELDPELHPRDQPFFVPVVFTREITMEEKVAAGVGSLPGSSCADLPPRHTVRDLGVILLARLRYRTTLAHELGHYFGLCHTHQHDPLLPEVTLREDGTPAECAACGATGDGVCDTPIDPGPDDSGCTLDDSACTVSCASGAAPDPRNLMSYYIPCRAYFSDEQAAYLRRGARLRLDAHQAAMSHP